MILFAIELNKRQRMYNSLIQELVKDAFPRYVILSIAEESFFINNHDIKPFPSRRAVRSEAKKNLSTREEAASWS